MNEIIKLLDKNLKYTSYEILENTIYVSIYSKRRKAICPYCNIYSKRVHSKYERSFQDLPILGKKIVFKLENKKYFCVNENCSKKTFSERFEFLEYKRKKTKRLEEEIINLSISTSSLIAEKILNKNIVKIKKSTICELLKKKKTKTLKRIL